MKVVVKGNGTGLARLSDRETVKVVAVAKRIDEHGGTWWPQGPVLDLPRAQVTLEALVMIAERWRRRERADEVALYEVPSEVFHRETAVEIVRTMGFHDE